MTTNASQSAILGITGPSGVGKTTLIENLLTIFNQQNITVNVIKSSHHDVTLEPEHKDSARFRRSGAHEVLLVSPYRYMIAKETKQSAPDFNTLFARLSPAQLTLVEGFRHLHFPKLEVYRSTYSQDINYPTNSDIIAVASDVKKQSAAPASLVWFDLNQPQLIAQWIKQSFLHI